MAVFLLFASSSAGAPSRSTNVTIRKDARGVLIHVRLHHRGPVAASLDGRRLIRRSQAPFRLRVSPKTLNATKRPRFVVRDLRTGRPLVIRYLQRQAGGPTLTLTDRPESLTTATRASFAWTTSATRTTCSLDGAKPVACTSPIVFTGLSVAEHAFTLVASTRNGKTSETVRWTVSAPPSAAPAPSPTPTPPTSPSTPAVTVVAPVPPTAYALPAGAVWVRNAGELAAALAGPALDIVLADGTYDQAAPFVISNGHHLYAEHVGRAVLRTGVVVGGNFGRSGAVLRGLAFDVGDTAKAFGGGIVHVWGASGAGAQVLDCTFRGNWAIPYGVLAYNPTGLSVERSQFTAFTDVALRLSDNIPAGYGSATPAIERVQDIVVDGVSRATPGSSNGTAEAGIWIGHPVRGGVRRIKVRNVAWAGIETVNNAWDTTFEDLDIDMSGPRQAAGVGVYMEHYTRNVVFDRMSITGVRVGFNGEWADPAWGGVAGARDVTIRNGVVDSTGSTLAGRQAGVYLDEGTESITVTGMVFRNQNWAGIGAYRTIGVNVFSANTFSLRPGATPVSNEHL